MYERMLDLLVSKRRSANLTQATLARTLGKPQSFVSKFEQGERRIDVVEFLTIARAVGADPYAILRRIEREANPATRT